MIADEKRLANALIRVIGKIPSEVLLFRFAILIREDPR
jgi:hypothetical protein